jgi:Plasmid replication region DNA-binding N-term
LVPDIHLNTRRTIYAITVIIDGNIVFFPMEYIRCSIGAMTRTSDPARRYGAPERGITAADVERAADALLRQGSRPTIEKVRAEIGSGSPNTINPLLDAWWQRLASRLDAGPAALHRLPEGVLHVAEALWLQALDEGRQRARLELTSSKRGADAEQRSLEVRSHVLTLREGELDERLRSRERALEESREQLLQLMSAVQRDQATIRARDTRIAALEADVASYRDQLKSVLARAVEKNRLLATGKKRRKASKPKTLKRKIPKKRPRILRTKRRAKRKTHGQRR